MEKAKPLVPIPCPEHPSQFIQRVNSDSFSSKHIYCLECLFHSEDPKASYSSMPSILEFLENIAVCFAKKKAGIKIVEGSYPKQFIEVLGSEAESLEKLTKHIDEEKKKVDGIFSTITSTLVEVINKIKAHYIKTLDDQILNLSHNYSLFEKELKSCFPKADYINMMFPSKEELIGKMSEISSSSGLEEFIKQLKKDCRVNFEEHPDKEMKILFLNSALQDFKAYEKDYPAFELKNLNVEVLSAKFKKLLEGIVKPIFNFAHPIRKYNIENNNILKMEDFNLIRSWLPAGKYKFSPKLLYKGSRDGMSPKEFHARCDAKGPTLTVIKCKFNGSSQVNVIGGFLDKDWHQEKAAIPSNEAFIFSLTYKIKCPVMHPEIAADGGPDLGPAFGSLWPGYDIRLWNDPEQSYVFPNAYRDAKNLLSNGERMQRFTPIDVEVYSVPRSMVETFRPELS